MARIKIYDTTLRDGMQAEGLSFSVEDKLAIVQRLDQLAFDYIEGGYAGSNPKEAEFFQQLEKLNLGNSSISAFGSTHRAGVKPWEDNSLNSLIACNTSTVTLVGKTWTLHVEKVLGCSLAQNLKICSDSVSFLKEKGKEVIFDAEHFYDSYKENPEYALKVLEAVIQGGADIIVLCDTNGGSVPEDVYEITSTVSNKFDNTLFGIHAHNDIDCATANSLAAVRAGARQVQGTINGFGERCGNANLCALIPNLAFKLGYEVLTPDAIKKLTEVSRIIFEIGNLNPVNNMPYVGESAFAHKGGLHIDALRKDKRTYEHIDPELIGNKRRILISELSGRSSILSQFEKSKLGEDKKLARKILNRIQDLENRGYQFETANASFDLLVQKTIGTHKPFFQLIKYYVTVEKRTSGEMINEATIKLRVGDQVEHVVGEGDGPVNALDAALRKALEKCYPDLQDMHLIDYKVRVVNAKAGTAAKVRVLIESRDKNSVWGTVGVSENIIDASWQALVDSIEYKLQKDKQ